MHGEKSIKNTEYYYCVCVCVCVSCFSYPEANLIFSAQHYIVIFGICLALTDFFTLTHKREDFLKKMYC